MRYIRLRIANYRGVSAAEVEFAETGITVVRGPNEVGKTSLGEAIWLLFEYPDSSKNREIGAIRPVHRDEGPEIELEAESGPYRFIYFKRYFKKPETRLTIIKPKAESLTSRPAHERAEAILQETLDIDLWKALSVRQGAEIKQPILKGQTWLSEALDQAAGGHSIDQRSESLFEAVHLEYLKYFTENGAEKKEILEHRKVLADCQSDVQMIEKAMQDLEHDVDLAVGLKHELGQLKRSEQEIVKDSESRSAKLEQVSKLELGLADAKLILQLAKGVEQSARTEKNGRTKLINDIILFTNTTNEMGKSCESSFASVNRAKGELEKIQEAFSEAEGKKSEIQKLIDLRQHDYEYLRHVLDLEQLSERKTRIDKARNATAKSEAILATNKVDEEALSSIDKAREDVISATAKLEAKSPIVLLRGLNKCSLTKDGTVINLRKGEERPYAVSDNVKFVVAEMLEIQVSAGSSINTLLKKVEDATTKLSDVCTSYGITDADKAREAFEERQQASRQIVNLKQVEKENLRDLTYEKLAGLLLGLQQSVPAYLPGRVLEPQILNGHDLTKAELGKLEKHKYAIETKWNHVKSTFDEAKEVHEELNRRYIEAKARSELSKDGLDKLTKMLERERALVADEAISAALVGAERKIGEAQIGVNATEASLKTLNPERERDLNKTAKESLSRIQERMKTVNTELIEVNTRLKINGEEGLYDKLNIAKSAFLRAEHEDTSLARRVSAINLLYETIRQERDKARHAYVAPLKERIETLGHLIYDDTLQIEVNDDLQIVSRTLQGATVDFVSLSGGTKEQLSLIFRLACAMMVTKDGGAPIMLDDTLGYTDPDRLLLMGAILAKAAKECQIVIFTCVPDRYSNIGAAKEIVMIK